MSLFILLVLRLSSDLQVYAYYVFPPPASVEKACPPSSCFGWNRQRILPFLISAYFSSQAWGRIISYSCPTLSTYLICHRTATWFFLALAAAENPLLISNVTRLSVVRAGAQDWVVPCLSDGWDGHNPSL